MEETPLSRVTRTKEEAQASYHRLSRWYDWLAGGSEWRLTERGLQLLCVHGGEKVLEVGFGTGRALVALAKAVGPTGLVCGIDLSPGMLAVARARLGKAGLAGRVHLEVGDAACLPFAANCFDAVFMSFTLELFDTLEIPVVLAECGRTLRPAGRIGVVALAKEDNRMVRLYEWAHRTFPRAVDCRPIYAAAASAEAGFQVTSRSTASMWGLPVEIVVAHR